MSYLLDTDVLSELLRKRPSSAVVGRVRACRKGELATSSICVMELRYGAVRSPRGDTLWQRISQQLLAHLEILPVDEAVGLAAGEILADLTSRGEPIETEDILIGATARALGLTLITCNLRHFERIRGLAVESWWE